MDDEKLFPRTCNMKRAEAAAVITKEVLEELRINTTRVAPLFELQTYNYTYKKHFSLERNEYLKCHWREFREKYVDRVVEPFQFLDARNNHFYNSRVQYLPLESVTLARASFPLTLKSGPGVDHIGQRPIPFEAFPRSSIDPEARPKIPRLVRKDVKMLKKERPFEGVKLNIDGKTYKTLDTSSKGSSQKSKAK